MRSTAKLNHKWDRKKERDGEKETETKADFCSGHEWVGLGWRRDTRHRNPCQASAPQVFHSTPQTDANSLDEMSGCQNID